MIPVLLLRLTKNKDVIEINCNKCIEYVSEHVVH